MKAKDLILLILLTFFSSCNADVKSVNDENELYLISKEDADKSIKSVFKIQNEITVGIEKFDSSGRLIFNRTTQIIEDWNNDLMSWMTAYDYQNELLVNKYYAHSNSGLRITSFDYDQNGNLKNEYYRYFDSNNRNGRNPFSEIYQIESDDSLISYLKKTIPDSVVFENSFDSLENKQEFDKTYKDNSNLIIKEYWTIEDSIETKRITEKYDSNKRLISTHYLTEYNEGIDYFKYDTDGHLIEELETWGSDKNSFQKREHLYENGLITKTLFYHDTTLAYTYEYFYKNSLLYKEVKTRKTNTEHFRNRAKKEEITYRYEFYK